MERLKYLSNATLEALRDSVDANAERYRAGDFSDLMRDGEWSIELQLEVDLSPLAELDPSNTPEAEVNNSRLVWQALHGLPPSLAYEEGIWVRLTHAECLEFSRNRWLTEGSDDLELVKAVQRHFFADTLTRRRDDNAVSRLWWNAYIANKVAPDDNLDALQIMLMKADMRANIIERSLTGSRPSLTAGILRAVRNQPWVTESEASFRSFMKALNRMGGGVVFEAMTEHEIDTFMLDCALRAGMPLVKQELADNTCCL